jgi:diguanylate cyclase (GGDEF)-like protein
MKTTEYINNQSKPFCIASCLTILFLIGVVDYITGEEISLSVFYLLPVSLATWRAGRWIGILFCFFAAIVWFFIDLITGHVYSHFIIPYWNAFERLCFFLIVSYHLSKLKNSLMQEKQLARTDTLTGLLNRIAFNDAAQSEIDKARRFKHPFTVAYMDLDNFKIVNDKLGHSVGDALLQLVADNIKKNTRVVDIVARLGGDEFIILLPETGIESAQLVFRKLQERIMEAMQENRWPTTLSIGAITYINPPDTVDNMIKKADSLMYSAKNSGKNTIIQELIDK